MVAQQGDVWWADMSDPKGSGPGFKRPVVVIQNDLFNISRVSTVIVVALTSNLLRGKAPGNILLSAGEGNLPKQSVVNVSQLFTLDKSDLLEQIGSLGGKRIRQILEGILLLLEPASIS